MSTYKYKHEGRRFTADTAAMKDAVFVTAQPTNVPLHGVWTPNADVPTVAAEILKAAGRDDLAALIESAAREAAERVEAEAAEKKLKERRDVLLEEFRAGGMWDHTSDLAQKAINRIIELEDGASRD